MGKKRKEGWREGGREEGEEGGRERVERDTRRRLLPTFQHSWLWPRPSKSACKQWLPEWLRASLDCAR